MFVLHTIMVGQKLIMSAGGEQIGHLIKMDTDNKWAYFTDKKNVVWSEEELELLLAKVKELNKI